MDVQNEAPEVPPDFLIPSPGDSEELLATEVEDPTDPLARSWFHAGDSLPPDEPDPPQAKELPVTSPKDIW